MPSAKKNLVIVESPAKAKTIEKYLGTDYKVVASMGHLRDLPKSTLGIDIENDFEPKYIPVKDHKEIIDELKKLSKNAKTVYLATDPDREGEAISWHLKELLALSDERARRVTFNEITKKVVTDSINKPRDIDNNLVDAQQARRLLDRLVGYKLSPLLWKKIRRGLSAGRVQSVATRMVVDRENEIRSFNSEEYWLLDAMLESEGEAKFTARFYGKDDKKLELKSEDEVNTVINATKDAPFKVKTVKRGKKHRSPSPPFITSTLQQEASRRLGMTPRRTMSIAQQLYEGVDIKGYGTVGLITYMRTDSLRLSDEALMAAKNYIIDHYGQEYYHGSFRVFKTKSGAQDAHEAIRPTNIELSPDVVRKDLTNEQYRLYRLIWGRFTACQMANAVYDNVVVDVDSAGYVFRANYSEMRFAGYTAVYEEGKDDDKEEKEPTLPPLTEGETLDLKSFGRDQHFTQPPAHYTDATLIRAMEEQGIGRPSTYAPTVSTILDREYVVKEGKYLHITNLGRVVTQLMEERFSDIADLKFTANMEKKLDDVEEGTVNWKSVLRDFYGDFEENLKKAEKDLEGVYIKVPDEVSEEICPVCGRNLVVKSGRFGRFLACPGFPECNFTMPLVVEMPGRCPKCGGRLFKRTGTSRKSGKQYTYYCCEHTNNRVAGGATCDFMTWDVPVKDDCPVCGKTMFKRAGKGYKRPYCINPECANFLPEDKRGYPKKQVEASANAEEAPGESDAPAEEKPAKKTVAKKPATKTAAKKTTVKKTAKKAEDGDAEKKPAAKKAAVKKAVAKTTTKKTTTKKTTKKAETTEE